MNLKPQVHTRPFLLSALLHFFLSPRETQRKEESFPFKREVNEGLRGRECWKQTPESHSGVKRRWMRVKTRVLLCAIERQRRVIH